MAKFSFKLPDSLTDGISKLGSDTDRVVGAMLEAGGEVVKEKVKSNLRSVIGQGIKTEPRSTGELESALGVSKMRLDKNGNPDVKVGFSEPRRDGKANAMIAGVLEYGKSGQTAKPFFAPAKKQAKNEVISVMQKVFDEEVAKLK